MANNQQHNAHAINADANSTNADQAVPAATATDTWDEERLENAMDTLKEMHIQLRNLRTTIPRLIAPLTVKQTSPDNLFKDFSKSINTANKEVQEFRVLMTSEESSKVLEHARKSRIENPSGIRPWKVSEHPDWLTRKP